jgi:ribonuclease BN (tRNA processing enzyme)
LDQERYRRTGEIAMRVTFLGTGVSIANPKRRSPGILLELDERPILLDAGPGTVRTLTEMEYSASRIHSILLTHLHLDHSSDYATLVCDRAFTTRETLQACGPMGLRRHSSILFTQLYPELASTLGCYDYLRIREGRQGPVLEEARWQAYCAPTEHADGIAYRIESERRSLLYSGDTEPCQSLVELGRDVDLAILECSFPDLASLKGRHLCPTTAAELAAKMNARKLVLTHMYPECNGRESEMLDRIKRIYDREVTLAEDGMTIVL